MIDLGLQRVDLASRVPGLGQLVGKVRIGAQQVSGHLVEGQALGLVRLHLRGIAGVGGAEVVLELQRILRRRHRLAQRLHGLARFFQILAPLL